ncbi:MAG: four helix bundle protein [bacterium]|jgi:four helix bundle protein
MLEYRRFSDTPVWQLAMDAAVSIFDLTESLPRKEDYALTSQIRRSANSIPANIAEAFGRYHRGNKLNFYYNARGSLCETLSHLVYMHRVGYIDEKSKEQLDSKLNEVWVQLNLIIKQLRDARS